MSFAVIGILRTQKLKKKIAIRDMKNELADGFLLSYSNFHAFLSLIHCNLPHSKIDTGVFVGRNHSDTGCLPRTILKVNFTTKYSILICR